MPLVDLSMVEQRYDAVREVLDGASVKDTATRYGVDRRTLHRWLRRYANEGLAALADRSTKPDRCPHQVAPEVEARIVELRRSHPGWGPRTILSKRRRELEQPPSRDIEGAQNLIEFRGRAPDGRLKLVRFGVTIYNPALGAEERSIDECLAAFFPHYEAYGPTGGEVFVSLRGAETRELQEEFLDLWAQSDTIPWTTA